MIDTISDDSEVCWTTDRESELMFLYETQKEQNEKQRVRNKFSTVEREMNFQLYTDG